MKNKLLVCLVLFEILIAANVQQNTIQSKSYKKMKESVDATKTRMPINNFIDVRDNVNSVQDKYIRAREAQQKQAELYEQLSK